VAPSRPRPPAFDDACAAVVSDPDGDHSLYTTLAPIYARMMADADERYDAQRRVLDARLPADVETVLELGCGVGGLLTRLAATYEATGLDRHPALLSFAAARHPRVVAGDPRRPPFDGAFDAACAFEYLAARLPLEAFCRGVHDVLRPGGIVVFDGVTSAAAVERSGVETYQNARYRLERAVDVSHDPVVVRSDYRVTDRQSGETALTGELTRVRTHSPESVETALSEAGFDEVEVSTEAGEEGAFVAAGVRPVEVT
jgi:SAM-dependent methyltransferase